MFWSLLHQFEFSIVRKTDSQSRLAHTLYILHEHVYIFVQFCQRINIEGHMITFSTDSQKQLKQKNDRDPFHHYLSNPRYHPENTRQHHSGTSPTNEETASSKRLLQRSTAEEDKGRKRRCESFPFELYNNNVIRLHGVRKQRRQRQYASFTSRYDIDHAVLYRSRIVGGWFFMSSRLSHKSRKSLWACVRMACFRPSITPCMLD